MSTKGYFAAISAAAAVASTVGGAHATTPYLPGLTNLDFSQTANSPKGYFTYVAPTGWSGGNNLVFVDSSTIPDADAAGTVYLQTYGDPAGAGGGGVKGNYVEADGNPQYESSINYQVTGLTVGQTYKVSFYQGASEQTGFGLNPITNSYSDTTDQWIVSLATAAEQISYNTGPYDPKYGQTSTYYNTDPNASVVASNTMRVAYQQTVGWEYQTVYLKADATTELLSFLAWGDHGSTVNLPPIDFLSGINSPPGQGGMNVPEPSVWALMLLGIGAVGAMARRRFAKRLGVAT